MRNPGTSEDADVKFLGARRLSTSNMRKCNPYSRAVFREFKEMLT